MGCVYFWDGLDLFAMCLTESVSAYFNDAMNSYVWALRATPSGWSVSSR